MRYGAVALVCLALGAIGCGDDDGGSGPSLVDGSTPTPPPGTPPTPPGTPPTPPGTPPTPPGTPPTPPPVDDDGGTPTPPPPTPPPPAMVAPGGACRLTSDCMADGDHAGLCVFGICMTVPSADCSAAGSSAECGAGSRCWALESYGAICWPDCASFECAGACDGDGSCAPTEMSSCEMCGSTCCEGLCSADIPRGLCEAAGTSCVGGECVIACSPDAPTGYCPTGFSCTDGRCVSDSGVPSWMCEADCTDLIEMPGSRDPSSIEAMTAGYYPSSPRQYSYLRRDLTLLIQYAAAMVQARYPGTPPIALGDLGQADGLTPGCVTASCDTASDNPRHPTTTHRGDDMDLAYFQTDGENNYQIVCGDGSDTNGNGRRGMFNDGYFCTTDMNIVDWERQAYWFAMLATTPLVRVFGIDQTFPTPLRNALRALYDEGAISDEQYDRALSLGYGADGGWQFHHHHSHMSYSRP
ncbi:MAG: hypothetical protein IT379_10860 [Deltaproteobacteria bacterium]|nr:hypothetical protein [Deltaproteobacteria bacterium]